MFSEEELSDGLFLKCQQAYEAAYRRYHMDLYRYAIKHTNPSAAEDIVQTVFLQLVQYDVRIKRVGAFLHRLTAVAVTEWLRNRYKHEQTIVKLNPTTEPPEAVVSRRERINAITDALRALPTTEQAALRATYFDDLSPDAAGERFGISAGAMRQRTSRAIEKLRGALVGSAKHA